MATVGRATDRAASWSTSLVQDIPTIYAPGTADRAGGMYNSPMPESAHIIGVISDTHGMVRPGVHAALAGVECILHAGDVGGDEVLAELRLIAPVYAVYGNTDMPGDPSLRETVEVIIGGLSVHVSHGHETGSPTPARLLARYNADVVVYGHTHRALVTRSGARMTLNPGAAGPARVQLAPSVARLTIADGVASAEIVPLD